VISITFQQTIKNAQNWVEQHIKYFGKGKYGRVLRMARKPDQEEYKKVVMITGLGIIIIGALGFLIYILMSIVAPYIASYIHI